MKFLLLNQTFHPDVVSTAQHLAGLAQGLTERGHKVTVVTGRRAYDSPDTVFPARENWRGVQIYRVFSTRFGKRSKWRRAADFASFIAACCLRLLLLPKPDVVVALTTPPLISFIGAVYARLRGARFCYWVMDFNPDEAIAAGWLRADSFLARCLDRLSRYSLHRAHRIIALDKFMKARIESKGIAAGKISVLLPWSLDKTVSFDAAGRDRFRKAHGLDDRFVVMYSGNHSPIHPLDTLMSAAEELQNAPDIVFCFIGGGSEFQRVKKWAASAARNAEAQSAERAGPLPSPRILCLPYQPLDQLSASLSAADLHAVVMGDAFVGLVHPCKIYNILTVGAPVLYVGPQPSHVTEILDELGSAHPSLCVRHGEAQKLAEQIRLLHKRSLNSARQIPSQVLTKHSQSTVLPRLIADLESA